MKKVYVSLIADLLHSGHLRILKEANCGFACKNDVESIKIMILKISKLKGNKLKKIGNNGRKFFLENFALDVVTFKTHKILQNIND